MTKYYINGEEVASYDVGDQTANTPTTPFVIGQLGTGGGYNMLGSIKDVRVYESTLTQSEITNIIGSDINAVMNPNNFRGEGIAGGLTGFKLKGDGKEWTYQNGKWEETT
jgi:hypothetical protein